MEDAPGAESLSEFRIRGIILIFRLLFRVEMIEVAKKFIEAMQSREILVLIAEVILAELAGRVNQWFQ